MAIPSQPLGQTIGKKAEAVSPQAMAIAWCLVAIAVLLQMVTNGRYGYFRDELYFIATSKHLAFGYVDFAPLAALVLRVIHTFFGDSLHAIRLLPALAYGAEVLLTGLIVIGGKIHVMISGNSTTLLLPICGVNQCLRVYFGAVSGVACC